VTACCRCRGTVASPAHDAVDPDPDEHVLATGLEVEVGSALLERGRQERVDEVDRRVLEARLQMSLIRSSSGTSSGLSSAISCRERRSREGVLMRSLVGR
jgi:hypothetical protein